MCLSLFSPSEMSSHRWPIASYPLSLCQAKLASLFLHASHHPSSFLPLCITVLLWQLSWSHLGLTNFLAPKCSTPLNLPQRMLSPGLNLQVIYLHRSKDINSDWFSVQFLTSSKSFSLCWHLDYFTKQRSCFTLNLNTDGFCLHTHIYKYIYT